MDCRRLKPSGCIRRLVDLFLLLAATGPLAELIEQNPHAPDTVGPVDRGPDGTLDSTPAGIAGLGDDYFTVWEGIGGSSHRRKWEASMVESIKEKILQKLGRTDTTAPSSSSHSAGGRRELTLPGVGHVDVEPADEEEIPVFQVRNTIVFSEIPVPASSENGTLEFVLRRNLHHYRVDRVDLHLRISAHPRTIIHRLRHHHQNPPSISVILLTTPRGGRSQLSSRIDSGEGPLPIARSSIRTKTSSGWQKIPLPSSVVQEIVDSKDPVLRLFFVCEYCDVLPSGTWRSSTHRRRDGGSYSRKRHGHDLPYITISTLEFLDEE